MRTRFSFSVLAVLFLLTPEPSAAIARAKYKAVFQKQYTSFQSKVSCSICHPQESKKIRNHYGKALGEELKGKDVKDEDAIKKALKKIEVKDCGGTIWKELLDKGQTPWTHKSSSHATGRRVSLIGRLLTGEQPDFGLCTSRMTEPSAD